MTQSRLKSRLDELAKLDLIRSRRVLEGPQGARVMLGGRELLAFCSNDYLGLANHPRINAAAIEAVHRFGVGAGASPLVTGHHALHQEVEEKLAAFAGFPRALLFPSGYQANIGAVTSLVGRGDAVFSDALNHASLIDGMRLSRAQVVRYPHGDIASLERELAATTAETRLVATDGVFSMDGDIAPLRELLALCERHDAWLLVDDAHGLGVLGEHGRGVLEHFGLVSPWQSGAGGAALSPRIVYVGTLGKAAGVCGAFVAGPDEVVETVLQRARTYMFSTAGPVLLAAAVSESLEVIRDEGWRRTHLKHLITTLRDGLGALVSELSPGGHALAPSQTPIQPLIVGANDRALALAEALRERGILVPAIRPPTVPEGSARLRISLSAAHSVVEVRQLVAALAEVMPALASGS